MLESANSSDFKSVFLSKEDYDRFQRYCSLLELGIGLEDLGDFLYDIRRISDTGDRYAFNERIKEINPLLEDFLVLMLEGHPDEISKLADWSMLDDGIWNNFQRVYDELYSGSGEENL